MSDLPNNVRVQVHRALRQNYGMIRFSGLQFTKDVDDTFYEMVQVSSVPFDAARSVPGVDTLDRHPKSCVGNLNEMVAILTLIKHDYCYADHIKFSRDFQEQVTDKIDFRTFFASYQVKTATRGLSGDVFINEADIQGKAEFLAIVDPVDRMMYVVHNCFVVSGMKEIHEEASGKTTWLGKSGWWVLKGKSYDFIDQYPIPEGVVTISYDRDWNVTKDDGL